MEEVILQNKMNGLEINLDTVSSHKQSGGAESILSLMQM